MSTPVDHYSAARLPATLRALHRLSLVAACTSAVLLIFVLVIETVLPVDDRVAVRDGIGLALVCVASWMLFAAAAMMKRAYPGPSAAFGVAFGAMIGLGLTALILNFVLDIALLQARGVLALAVPAGLVICVVIPGVYIAFTARAVNRAASTP